MKGIVKKNQVIEGIWGWYRNNKTDKTWNVFIGLRIYIIIALVFRNAGVNKTHYESCYHLNNKKL